MKNALDYILADNVNMAFLWNEKQMVVINAARKELKTLRRQNKDFIDDAKALTNSIASLKDFVNLSGLTFKKKDGSGIGSGEALVFGQFITNIDEAIEQHNALMQKYNKTT